MRDPLRDFVKEYKQKYIHGLSDVETIQLNGAIDAVNYARNIFVAGNGGSAAISNHLCCDFTKGCDHKGFNRLKVTSLSCNIPMITAIANDISYDETISYQLETLLSDKDVVILISSSGKSQNILNAAAVTRKRHATLIGLTGFDGGVLKNLADISLHVPINNYGVVEDVHQSLMHIIAQYIKENRGGPF